MILCPVGEVYIFYHGHYISAMDNTIMLKESSYVHLAYKVHFINIFTLGWFSEVYVMFQIWGHGL